MLLLYRHHTTAETFFKAALFWLILNEPVHAIVFEVYE